LVGKTGPNGKAYGKTGRSLLIPPVLVGILLALMLIGPVLADSEQYYLLIVWSSESHTLTNYVVLVPLDNVNAIDGRDIYVIDNNKVAYVYWVEYNNDTHHANVWILIPRLDPNTPIILTVHYGGVNPYYGYRDNELPLKYVNEPWANITIEFKGPFPATLAPEVALGPNAPNCGWNPFCWIFWAGEQIGGAFSFIGNTLVAFFTLAITLASTLVFGFFTIFGAIVGLYTVYYAVEDPLKLFHFYKDIINFVVFIGKVFYQLILYIIHAIMAIIQALKPV